MTAPATTRSGVGLRHIQLMATDADGHPNATSTTVYEGLHWSGAQAFNLTDPASAPITHRGDDRPFAQDVLPSAEPMTGDIRTAKTDDAVDVILTGQSSITIGEAKFFGLATDKKGDEAQVIILAYWQSLNTDEASSNFGKRVWESRLIPRCIVVPQAKGSEIEKTEEKLYTLNPQFVRKYPWGVTFGLSTEGFEQAQALRAVTEYKPKLVAWKADGATTEFLFPTDAPAAAVGKVTVWVSDSASVPDTTLTTAIQYTTAPTTDAMIVCLYEVEDE